MAQLIDDMSQHAAGHSSMSHAHRHQAEIQILTGKKGQSLVPGGLDPHVDLTISPQGGRFIEAAPSYRAHVPKLADVVAQAPGKAFIPSGGLTRNPQFIRNTIIVNRGTIRAKEFVTWDSGGFPLDGSLGAGGAPAAPVNVRFMSSAYAGQIAGECIIDVEGATGVELASTDNKFIGKRDADLSADRDNQHVPPETVEILITNLPEQRLKPVPWSVHYQWLFKAAGYQPAQLDVPELDRFKAAATAYAGSAFDFNTEDLPLLEGTNHDRGLPFPYLEMPNVGGGGGGLTTEAHLAHMGSPGATTDPWNRPLCPHGDE